jgi:hypothetical protein
MPTEEKIPLVVNRSDNGVGGWSLHLDLAGHEGDDLLCAGTSRWIPDKNFKQIRGIGRWARPNQKDLAVARRVARQRLAGMSAPGIDLG